MSVSRTFNGVVNKTSNSLSDLRKNLNAAVENLETNFRKIALSAATESGNAIVVTGTVKDAYGTTVAAAVPVMVRTLAVTANAGDITVVSGTEVKTVNPATGENVSWITTTSGGVFSVSVANANAEVTVISAECNNGYVTKLVLDFAAV